MVNAGRLSEGAAELRAARAAGEDAPPDTDFYLALAYDGLRQTDAALTAYRRFLTAHPDSIHSESVRERIKIIELRRSLQGQGPGHGQKQ
jgi:biotin synthase-related radical SAM superfamily protein